MARNKRSNRKIELHMMDLELLSLLAQARSHTQRQKSTSCGMESSSISSMIFCPVPPSTSIRSHQKEYAEMEAEITALREERLDALDPPPGKALPVYNTTGFVRSDVVELGDCKAEALQDEAGNIYPVQKTADGAVAFLNLPAKGSKTLQSYRHRFRLRLLKLRPMDIRIDTPFYTVTFDEHGQMTGIFDKENLREVLKPGQAGNLFRVYEDKPIYYDNWDIDIFYTEKFWDVTDLQDFHMDGERSRARHTAHRTQLQQLHPGAGYPFLCKAAPD